QDTVFIFTQAECGHPLAINDGEQPFLGELFVALHTRPQLLQKLVSSFCFSFVIEESYFSEQRVDRLFLGHGGYALVDLLCKLETDSWPCFADIAEGSVGRPRFEVGENEVTAAKLLRFAWLIARKPT